ncbi:MAG: response regulator, partial [Saprospiraceae bacterium]|nr:response regulator [Saprospiraceae bacterium]
MSQKSSTIILLLIACTPLIGQQDTLSNVRNEALRLYDIAADKRQNYIEIDSIYYYLTETKKLCEKIDFDSLTFLVNNDLAYWYELENDLDPIPELLHNNLNIARKFKDLRWENSVYVSHAKYLISREDLTRNNRDSIEFYLNKVINSALDIDDYVHFMLASNLLADYFIKHKEWQKSIEAILQRALKVKDKDHETKIIQNHTFGLLGKYYLQIGNFKQSIKTLEPLPIVEYALGNYRWVYDDLAQAYYAAGDYKNAYLTSRKSEAYADSLAHFNRQLAIQRSRYAYDTDQKEELITQLRENERLRALSAKKQSGLIKSILISTIAIIGLLILLVRNNMKRIKADKDLIHAQHEMAEVKSKLFTNITHEFRTPLTVIIGMANRLRGNLQEQDLIVRNANQLMDMVNQILDLSRFDSGTLHLQYTQSDIISYLSYLTSTFELLARRKGVQLTYYSEEEKIVMDFDPKQIKHIISNLLANAIKFTDQDEQVVVHVKREENSMVIKVKDTGTGISEEDLPHIFDRFFQVNNNKQLNVGGTGIGLALVKELVDLMKGEISVISSLTVGTTMTIKLPITNNAPMSDRKISSDSTEVINNWNDHGSHWTSLQDKSIVLLIKDNPDVQTYIESCIGKGYTVEKAYDGEQGINKAFELIPDIIICDLMMPKMDGYEVSQILKKDLRTNHIPIIILTAKATDDARMKGLETGADAYLTKPFQEEELQVRIKKLIELREVLQKRFTNENGYKEDLRTKDPFLHKLLRILEENFGDEQFSVNALAKRLNLSRMQTHRKIKAITNMSTT